MNDELSVKRYEFAEHLKNWRARHEYTQMEAAIALGVGIDTYRCWEQCVHIPSGQNLEEIMERTKST